MHPLRTLLLAVVLLVPSTLALAGDAFRYDGHLGPGAWQGRAPTDRFVFNATEGDALVFSLELADPDARVLVELLGYRVGCNALTVECVPGEVLGTPIVRCPLSEEPVNEGEWTVTLPATRRWEVQVRSFLTPVGRDYHLEAQVAGTAGDFQLWRRDSGTSFSVIAESPVCGLT